MLRGLNLNPQRILNDSSLPFSTFQLVVAPKKKIKRRVLYYLLFGGILIVCSLCGLLSFLFLRKTESGPPKIRSTCFHGDNNLGMDGRECVKLLRKSFTSCVVWSNNLLLHLPVNEEWTDFTTILINCVMDKMKLRQHGAPNLKKVTDFMMAIYFQTFIDNISDFKQNLLTFQDCPILNGVGSLRDILAGKGLTPKAETMLNYLKCFILNMENKEESQEEEEIGFKDDPISDEQRIEDYFQHALEREHQTIRPTPKHLPLSKFQGVYQRAKPLKNSVALSSPHSIVN